MQTVTHDAPVSYTRTAIALHWLIAVAVLAQIALGSLMVDVPKSPPGVRAYWFNLHKSTGITIALLVLARLAWRFTHRPPPLPVSVPRWQRLMAKASHATLYVCLLVQPVSGLLGSCFTKYPIRFFGQVLPRCGRDAPGLKELLSVIHYVAAVILVALIAVHVAAALKHLVIDRDGVFGRMWRWPVRRGSKHVLNE